MTVLQRRPGAALAVRAPCAGDGAAVHRLISRCPPLDTNSLYCNLLQCSHFAATSAIAYSGADAFGFVSGYRAPCTDSTLFIWQVAVAPEARGLGLAKRLIRAILERPDNHDITAIETTITPDNGASWSLFTAVARDLAAPISHATAFDRERHFGGAHATEMLVSIGPFHHPSALSSTLRPRRSA